ncbi:hypothetical protein BRD19_03700 [Halobacteriales archaeon SW_7_65_23]|jgi:hypothetical protein|nr:MAG: hypothetical protein BRD19_03700 [Halobacteriales archaeon SW_7_65_23]
MELSRRDAVAALAALGIGAGAVGISQVGDSGSEGPPEAELPDDAHVEAVAVAVAEVLYPSAVTGVDEFVSEFLSARLSREGHSDGVREAVATVDDHAQQWHGEQYVNLDDNTRDRVLRELGTDTAEEDPEGTVAERVRYYLVNDLLLALYASPTGGELVGIENPQGHPGGTDTYQRGPQ